MQNKTKRINQRKFFCFLDAGLCFMFRYVLRPFQSYEHLFIVLPFRSLYIAFNLSTPPLPLERRLPPCLPPALVQHKCEYHTYLDKICFGRNAEELSSKQVNISYSVSMFHSLLKQGLGPLGKHKKIYHNKRIISLHETLFTVREV